MLLHLLNFEMKKFEQFGRCQAGMEAFPLLWPTNISNKLMMNMHSLSITALAHLPSCSIVVGPAQPEVHGLATVSVEELRGLTSSPGLRDPEYHELTILQCLYSC